MGTLCADERFDSMNAELERRIESQDAWTFRECLGLAVEFDVKVRMVVALVMARGKRYTDGKPGGSFAAGAARDSR